MVKKTKEQLAAARTKRCRKLTEINIERKQKGLEPFLSYTEFLKSKPKKPMSDAQFNALQKGQRNLIYKREDELRKKFGEEKANEYRANMFKKLEAQNRKQAGILIKPNEKELIIQKEEIIIPIKKNIPSPLPKQSMTDAQFNDFQKEQRALIYKREDEIRKKLGEEKADEYRAKMSKKLSAQNKKREGFLIKQQKYMMTKESIPKQIEQMEKDLMDSQKKAEVIKKDVLKMTQKIPKTPISQKVNRSTINTIKIPGTTEFI